MAFQTGSLQDYNSNSSWQLDINLSFIPLISKHLSAASELDPSFFRISDYGSSEGFNSMLIFQKSLSLLRESSEKPVHIFHTDLPENTWSSLCSLINDSDYSYKTLPNIFYSCIGQSFYSQLFPSNFIHFGYSALAFHFLSKLPEKTCNIKTRYPEIISQAKEDLQKNLAYRIEELATGGILTFIAISKEESEDYALEKYIIEPIKILFEKGLIRLEEFEGFSWPTVPLDLREVKEVLDSFGGRIEVLDLELRKCPHPYYRKFLEGLGIEEYHRKFKGHMRVLLKNPLYRCLIGRTEAEKQRILDSAISELDELVGEREVHIMVYCAVIKKLV